MAVLVTLISLALLLTHALPMASASPGIQNCTVDGVDIGVNQTRAIIRNSAACLCYSCDSSGTVILNDTLSQTCPSGCINASLSSICGCLQNCPANVCDPNPCRNNGTCVTLSNNTDFTCTCQGGYSGKTCLVCKDKIEKCKRWSTVGKCEDKPEKMVTRCAHTCKFCRPPKCRRGWKLHKQSCYLANDTRVTYQEAKTVCSLSKVAGYKPYIFLARNRNENSFVRKQLDGPMWVGAQHYPTLRAWVKADGTLAFVDGQYVNWVGGVDPGDNTGDKNCLKMGENGGWTIFACNRKNVFVCVYDL